jgi:hypothetical protein
VQLIALMDVRLAAACSFSFLIISAAVLAFGEGLLALGLGGTGRLALFGAFQLVALTGVRLSPPPRASARSSSWLLLSPSAWAAQATSRCSARVQLIALTGVTFAAACSFSFLIISAAVLAWAAQAASRCLARVLLVVLTGVGLAAPALCRTRQLNRWNPHENQYVRCRYGNGEYAVR